MAESGLLFRSLSDIAAQIRRQEVSPVEVTRVVLDRLEHLNPRLNAVLTNLGEQALEAATRAEHDLVVGQPRVSLRRFTQPFNLTGSPAITVPYGFSRDGLPIGLQLIGRPFDEARLLNLAFAYEHSTPWQDCHPAL